MKLASLRDTRLLMPGACVLLLLLTAAVYWPGLGGGFMFDDHPVIVDNAGVHLEQINTEGLARAAFSFEPGGALNKRPLVMATFAIDHARAGMDASAFKRTNLLIHLVNALLVFAFVFKLLALPAIGRSKLAAVAVSLAIAAAWAVHPLQISSVLYAVQRMELMATTFLLLALIAYLAGRIRQTESRIGWPYFMACVPLVALGLACKETAALFPAFALVLELTVLRFSAGSARDVRILKTTYAVGMIAGLVLFVAVIVPHFWQDEIIYRNFGTWERLLTQLRVLCLYLAQIVLPIPSTMTFFYDDYAVSTGVLSPATTLLSGVALLLLVVAAVRLRRRIPLFTLGVLWFFAAHAISSNVVPLELAFEHRNYFALLGIVLAITALVMAAPLRDGPRLKQVGVAVAVLLIAAIGLFRSLMWSEPLLWASEATNLNPHSSRASSELAAVYLEMTDGYPNSPFVDFAIRELERSSSIPGSSPMNDQGLILIAAQSNRPVDAKAWPRFIAKLETQPITPDATRAVFGLLERRYAGVELDDAKLTDAALVVLNRAEMPAYSYAQVGEYVMTFTNDVALASRLFERAVERSTNDPAYVEKLIRTLADNGNAQQAEAALQRAVELGVLSPEFTIEPSPRR
jgi:hypothetical protein